MQQELQEKNQMLQEAIDKQHQLEIQLAESDKAKNMEEKLELELKEKNRKLQDAIEKQTNLEKELAFEKQNSNEIKKALRLSETFNASEETKTNNQLFQFPSIIDAEPKYIINSQSYIE